ncbi:hypothetical protein [Paraburkholderia bannensis]|uniref:hypothetical protein n=1 Tax=Paraburkholderia bannensis TaxID=765414 RepID=UPI002ABD68C6|nr:hypothetical protein [Paraburkholderia bannensis]
MPIPESPQGVVFIHAALLSERIKQVNRHSVKGLPSPAENQRSIKICKFNKNIYSAQEIGTQIGPYTDAMRLPSACHYMKNITRINLLQDIFLRDINIHQIQNIHFASKTE